MGRRGVFVVQSRDADARYQRAAFAEIRLAYFSWRNRRVLHRGAFRGRENFALHIAEATDYRGVLGRG